MFEPGAVFEVSDGELDGGVLAVERVGGDGVEVVAVGDEGVVAPVGPQPALGAVGEAGAAHHEADLALVAGDVGGLCYLGLSAGGVGDGLPVGLGDGGDSGFDLGDLAHGDRPSHVVGIEAVDELPGTRTPSRRARSSRRRRRRAGRRRGPLTRSAARPERCARIPCASSRTGPRRCPPGSPAAGDSPARGCGRRPRPACVCRAPHRPWSPSPPPAAPTPGPLPGPTHEPAHETPPPRAGGRGRT